MRTVGVALLVVFTATLHSSSATLAAALTEPTFVLPVVGADFVRSDTWIQWNASASAGATYRLMISRAPSESHALCGIGDVLVTAPLTGTSYFATALPVGEVCIRLIVTVGVGTSEFTDRWVIVRHATQVGADFGLQLTGDVLFYRPSDGAWTLRWAPGLTGPSGVWSSDWTIQVGDFNGDKVSDLFFYNPVTGRAVRT